MKSVLIIAGSDSGGGAGIQADIKTACAHEVFAATAITALTAQNTQAVQDVLPTTPEFVSAQIKSVLDDIKINTIKIGMLANADIIDTVHSSIINHQSSIILDPVMISTSGDKLLEDKAIETLKLKLIPLATLVTPNIPEAEILADMKISSTDDMIEAGNKILDLGAKAVLIKGGHMEDNEVVDILITKNLKSEIRNQKLNTKNTHGTGCSLAPAIACNLANGLELPKATEKAITYIHNAIQTAPDIGNGNGPINHFTKP